MRIWAATLILPVALTLAACKREPDFDERYKTASEKIGRTAREIDAQVAGTGTPATEEETGDR